MKGRIGCILRAGLHRYGVPSSAAAQLEEVFREKLPAQFGTQPDLLFDPVRIYHERCPESDIGHLMFDFDCMYLS